MRRRVSPVRPDRMITSIGVAVATVALALMAAPPAGAAARTAPVRTAPVRTAPVRTAPRAAGEPGTNIGNAGQLTGSGSGSLASSSADDWWVIYPGSAGGTVTVKVTNAAGSGNCTTLSATLDASNGAGDTVAGLSVLAGSDQTLSGQRQNSDRYFVEVTVAGNCAPAAGQPVKYQLSLSAGGGGSAPDPATGDIAAGTSIGGAWPPLQGHASYTGKIDSGSTDAWYVLVKKPDTDPATVRVENTTDAGSAACDTLNVSLYASDGSDNAVGGVVLLDNSADTFTVPAEAASDPQGLYYLEIRNAGACPTGGARYRVEPEPASQYQDPAKTPAGSAAPAASIGTAWPPLQGDTAYQGKITSGTAEDWYILYRKSTSVPATVRVLNTTVSGSTTCDTLNVTLDAADGTGATAGGVVLSDNTAATLAVPVPSSPDYLGRYFLEISNAGQCAAGGATYRIEPGPADGWADPARPGSGSLPAGPDRQAAGGPLTGGVSYDGSLADATSQDWVFLDARSSAPLTASVENTTGSQDNCQTVSVSVYNAQGSTVGGANLLDDDGSEFVVDSAGAYYLEASVAGDCDPKTPLGVDVTLTPAGNAKPAVLKVARTTLTGGVADSSYSATIEVSDGDKPYKFTPETPLPDGLKLNPKTGKITGTPHTPGRYRFLVKITDKKPGDTVTDPFTVTIAKASCSCVCSGSAPMAAPAAAADSCRIAGYALGPPGGDEQTDPMKAGYVAPVIWDQHYQESMTELPTIPIGQTLVNEDKAIDDVSHCDPGAGRVWRSCLNKPGEPTTGPTLDWPVVTAAGTAVAFRDVQVWLPAHDKAITDAKLAGAATITVGGEARADELEAASLSAPASDTGKPVNVPFVRFAASGDLTARPGRATLKVAWTLDGRSIGTTTSLVYVAPAGPFATVTGSSGHLYTSIQPYLSLVELAVDLPPAAFASPRAEFTALFAKFTGLSVHREALNPVAGTVSPEGGAGLGYYRAGWTWKGQVTGSYDRYPGASCGTDAATDLLADGNDHCGQWADFLGETAAVDGITSVPFGLGFKGSPYDNRNKAMLVGKWTFSKSMTYRYTLHPHGTDYHQVTAPPQFGGAAGQGPNPRSPGYFALGDHALVAFDGDVWDPSYGKAFSAAGPLTKISGKNPCSGAGLTALGCWARYSIAGYADPTRMDLDDAGVYESPTQCPADKAPDGRTYECEWQFTAGPGHLFDHVELP
jgi:hypothetical protein